MSKNKTMNIYLDVDGVLLANEYHAANHSGEFIRYVLKRYPDSTYWLTTHCNGDPSKVLERIGHLFDPEVQAQMRKIKPTAWEVAKTRAIDFSQPFLWFDDDLFDEERRTLEMYGATRSWIEVDLAKDQNQLSKFIENFPTLI